MTVGITQKVMSQGHGFKQKVLDNPIMNGDHRNVALIGTTDGVPFFDDQKRGAWPFVFRCANLPDSLSKDVSNCHLGLLSANEHWALDKDANVLKRVVRGPKSFKPHTSIIVDDLLGAYSKGTCFYVNVFMFMVTLPVFTSIFLCI